MQSGVYLFIYLVLIHVFAIETIDESIFADVYNDGNHHLIDDCVPLAFGDFNADKIVDIFCRTSQGDSIRVMLNDGRSIKSKEQDRVTITGIIYDVLAADYDADSKLDLFLLYKNQTDQMGYNGGFLWGDRVKLSTLQPIDYYFETIPTNVDVNGDSHVDLLGMISQEPNNYQSACLTFKNRTVHNFVRLTDVPRLLPNGTQAIVDLTHDLVADLFLTIDHQQRPKFRVYHLPVATLNLIIEYDPPPQVALYHLSTFADIDADGEIEHLLPVCMDFNCFDSRIYVREYNEWHQLPLVLPDGMRFPVHTELPAPFNNTPFSIKIADYNLDGFPDITLVMKQGLTGDTIPVILRNQACDTKINTLCTYNRTFVLQHEEKSLLHMTNATLVAFFDFLENGYLDLLIVRANQNDSFTVFAVENSLTQDVYFIKVMVLSTFSCSMCPRQQKLPYGNNQPGQSIKMETVSPNSGMRDEWVRVSAVQMSQAGRMTLELPYVIIGLGSTPNFVEQITVGLPPNIQSNELFRTYTQMIPNSQIVVIPTPLLEPDKWPTKLFVTASRMILQTGIALAMTLVIIVIVMAILQYREKTEDNRERKEQSQSFHYDAL